MKRFVWLLGAALLLLLSAAGISQEQRFAELGDFKLKSGEVLRDCRVGYRTFGTLNEAKSNVIVMLTWAGGTTEQLAGSVGPGKLADTTKYYVVLIDALANGVSSSPSNSKAQPHMRFPKITVEDMVATQHELLTRVLHIEHVKDVMGTSMGGMQTFQWMVEYPTFMDKAIAIAGSPRLAAYDVMHWQAEIDWIKNDPGWQEGDYTKNPARGTAYEIGAILLTTPEHYNRTHTRENALQEIAKAKAGNEGADSNNTIRQSEAMMALDISLRFGGSMEKAAEVVKAKTLVIVAKQDHTVTPGPATEFARLLGAEFLELDNECGHLLTSCENEKVQKAVAAFLER